MGYDSKFNIQLACSYRTPSLIIERDQWDLTWLMSTTSHRKQLSCAVLLILALIRWAWHRHTVDTPWHTEPNSPVMQCLIKDHSTPTGAVECWPATGRHRSQVTGDPYKADCIRLWPSWGGFPWFSMIAYDFLWFSMLFYDFLWFSMTFHDFLWFSMIFHDFPWFSMVFHAFLWFSVIFHDFLWFSMIFYDFPWFSMVFYGEFVGSQQ